MADQNPSDIIDNVGVAEAARRCRVAGAIFTYGCNLHCRHCLFSCRDSRPDVAMTPRQCATLMRQLHRTGRVVHIAGGEPMFYWGI